MITRLGLPSPPGEDFTSISGGRMGSVFTRVRGGGLKYSGARGGVMQGARSAGALRRGTSRVGARERGVNGCWFSASPDGRAGARRGAVANGGVDGGRLSAPLESPGELEAPEVAARAGTPVVSTRLSPSQISTWGAT